MLSYGGNLDTYFANFAFTIEIVASTNATANCPLYYLGSGPKRGVVHVAEHALGIVRVCSIDSPFVLYGQQ